MIDDLGSFEPHLPCRCQSCALKHGDQADTEQRELDALRDEVCRLKAELKEQQELIDRVTARIEADTAVMQEVVEGRAWLEQTGNELCGLAFDIERANAARVGLAMCAYCGAENLRQGEAMRAHMESCAKHPMAALRAERDGAITEAAAAKRERDVMRAQLESEQRVCAIVVKQAYDKAIACAAALVAEEREACAGLVARSTVGLKRTAAAIRARGQP